MSAVLYLEPIGGIAGDMFLAAAIDLGVDPEEVSKALKGLGVPGWSFKISKQSRHQISGTHLDVEVDPSAVTPERALSDITALINGCGTMTARMKEHALRTFDIIGRAEAKVHGVPLSKIHFHEVGAVDSIVDICGAAVVYELLGAPETFASPPPMGSGTTKTAHGTMPVPPPATMEILHGVPVRFEGVGELTTPTGAAILKSFAKVGSVPSLITEKTGYGVGTRDWKDRANVLRMSLAKRADAQVGEAFVLEANLDDCSPQLLALIIERALAEGALDAWVAPVTMKKGRPGHVLGVLARADAREKLTALLFSESTTLGVRSYAVERSELERRHDTVSTRFGDIRIKIGHRGGAVLNANPEYEDCRAAAEKSGTPVKIVWAEALAAWTSKR